MFFKNHGKKPFQPTRATHRKQLFILGWPDSDAVAMIRACSIYVVQARNGSLALITHKLCEMDIV